MAKEKSISNPVGEVEKTEVIMERKTYLDYIRIIAAVFVIAIHVVSYFLNSRKAGTVSVGTTSWYFNLIVNSLVRVAVPLYVMISGALLLDERKEVSIKKLLLNKVLRLAVIFFLWAYIYIIYKKSLVDGFSYMLFLDAFKYIAQGDFHYHLWFLPMIIGLYLLTPVLRLVCKKENRKVVEYILIVYLVTIAVYFFAGRALDVVSVTTLNFAKQFLPQFIINYVGIYILGWYLANLEFSKKFRVIVYSVGFTMYFIGPGIDIIYSLIKNSAVPFVDAGTGIWMVAATSAIFLSMRYSKRFNKENKVIKYLSSLTFGIYLIHPFIRNKIFEIFGKYFQALCLTSWSVALIPVYIIVIFLLSAGITALINLIPKKIRKWIL